MLKRPVVRTVMAISLGAIAGALCRYYLGLGIGHLLGTSIPYGTLIINLHSAL
jgi:CrcB protein